MRSAVSLTLWPARSVAPQYLRTITHAHSGDGPSDVLITNERGHLVSYSATSLNMYVHTMNGQLLAQTRVRHTA